MQLVGHGGASPYEGETLHEDGCLRQSLRCFHSDHDPIVGDCISSVPFAVKVPMPQNLALNRVALACMQPGVLRRLLLFETSARVALANALLPHTDALIRSAISDAVDSASPSAAFGWADVSASEAEAGMVSLSCSLSSLLVVVPGHPEVGPFVLLNGLRKARLDSALARRDQCPIHSLAP